MSIISSKLENIDSATLIGLATATGVYLIFNNALPSAADVRQAPPDDTDVSTARKQAAYKSAALVALVFLVARDLNSYIISGTALVGIDLMYKHANMVSPATGKIDASAGGESISNVYPLPDYSTGTDE